MKAKNDIKTGNPTKRTDVLLFSKPDESICLAVVLCNFLTRDTSRLLHDQMTEWIVPSIAESVDMCMIFINQLLFGSVCFNTSGKSVKEEVNNESGVDIIIEPINNIYNVPTIKMEYVRALGTFF